LQGTQSHPTKANLAKELAFPHTGHTLPFVATQTDRVEARTPYMGFAKMGAAGSRVSTFCYSIWLHIQINVINLAMCISSTFIYKFSFS